MNFNTPYRHTPICQTFCFMVVCSILIITSACGQLSSLQTAEALGKGNMEAGIALYGNTLTGSSNDNIFYTDNTNVNVIPSIELLYRYGINDNWDIGVKASTGLDVMLSTKYQLVGNAFSNNKFALALGTAFAIQGGVPANSFVWRAHLPLFLSYHPNAKWAVYAAPRYVHQFVSDDADSNFWGSSFGLAYDASALVRVILETNIYTIETENSNNSSGLVQIGLGTTFRF